MTDPAKEGPEGKKGIRLERLELNKETIRDLTESEAEGAVGGAFAKGVEGAASDTCNTACNQQTCPKTGCMCPDLNPRPCSG